MQENSTPPISQGKSPLFTTLVLGVVSLLALTGMIAFIYFTFFKNSNSEEKIIMVEAEPFEEGVPLVSENELKTPNLELDTSQCQPTIETLTGELVSTTIEVKGKRPLTISDAIVEYCSIAIKGKTAQTLLNYSCLVPVTSGKITLENDFYGMDAKFLLEYCSDMGGMKLEPNL